MFKSNKTRIHFMLITAFVIVFIYPLYQHSITDLPESWGSYLAEGLLKLLDVIAVAIFTALFINFITDKHKKGN
ncbi:MAG: hypothetical protein L3J46_05245 [Kangiellaceae bacterium]|nr:hypothetical protein [Kangiellaceae bacterium]